MTITQVSPPAALAVSLDDAAVTLRLDADVLASVTPQLSLMINALAQEAEHQIGRKLINRQMRVTLDEFPHDCGPEAIELSGAPVASVDSITYRDEDGAWQTLDPQDYELDAASSPGWVAPAPGCDWPATQDRMNSVKVDYAVGYGPTDASVPECARQYILLRLADLWDPAAREFKDTAASRFANGLLDSLRVYG